MYVESNEKIINVTGCSVEIETQGPVMPYDNFPECHNLVAKDRRTGEKQIIAQFEDKKEAKAVHAKIRDALKKNENFVNISDGESGDQNTAMGEITHVDLKDDDKVGQPLQENGIGTSRADLLPKPQLHPVIIQKALPIFEKGLYDSAVFEAFKQVEIAVRKAGDYTDADLGTDLMRRAFHVDTGKLTDQSQHHAEKQARSDMFAGAIGSYKNPGSHRAVEVTMEEATEVIIVASHLLRIVDSRNQ